jgi:hypothetical protein
MSGEIDYLLSQDTIDKIKTFLPNGDFADGYRAIRDNLQQIPELRSYGDSLLHP